MEKVFIRNIEQKDNAIIAKIIRAVLIEYDAAKPGTVYYDATTDALYELFDQPGAAYFVAEQDGEVLGGAGFFPTAGLPETTCELVKMYLLPEGRGKGLGKKLIEHCFARAKHAGYTQMYLETMPELKEAIKLYERTDFKPLDAAVGSSCHFSCGIWMMKDL